MRSMGGPTEGVAKVCVNLLAMAGFGIAASVYSFLKRVNHDKQKGNRLDRGAFLGTEDVYPCTFGTEDVSLSKDDMIEFQCLCSLDYQKYRIDLHDDWNDRLRFLKEVYECLKTKVDSGSKLRSFYMGCCFLDDCAPHLDDWIQTIAGLGVEELSLGNPCGASHLITFSFQQISGVSTLRRLSLFACQIDPGFIGQHNLIASLELDFISLQREEILDILHFCPNLQLLRIRHCKLPWKLRIFGPDIKLKHLRLYSCSGLHELDISAGNLVNINMDSPNNVELLLSSVPKLEYLSLVIAGTPFCFGEVPRDLPQLKFLAIQATIQDMNEIPGMSPSFEMFGNIRILHLLIKRYWHKGACLQVDLWNFTPVLSSCPHLELFTLMVEGRSDEVERKVQWPVLQHKHLHRVELSGFSNTQNELEFAKFILRSAEALHWLVLRTCFRQYDGHQFCLFARSDPRGKISESEGKDICANLQRHALSTHARVEGRYDEVKKRVQWPVLQHKHLDHVELAGFSNTRNELEFAKFILRSAQALHWLVPRTCIREYDGRCFRRYARSDPRGKLSKRQAKHICSKLQRHALSKRARVKVF